jgi:uncharacterized membrane protein YeaQ/YmgE (transglycosylase-associated protein family)
MSRARTERAYAGSVILAVFIALIAVFIVLPLIWHVFWLVFWAAVFGIIWGALGRLIVPGRQQIGILATIACGWIGSLAGLLVGHRILHLGGLTTALLEIGGAAVAVAFWSSTHRTAVRRGRGSRPAIGR